MSDVGAISGMSPEAWRTELSVRLLDKVLDTTRQRGEAAMRLMDDAAAVSQQGAKGGAAPDPMGISGRRIDRMA